MYLVNDNKKVFFTTKVVTCATLITLIRLVLIVPIVYFIQTEKWTDAFGWFVGAAFTDGIDGAVARSMNECTSFGAAFDAFVDKVFVMVVAAALMSARYVVCSIPTWFYLFVLLKECAQLVGACMVHWYCGFVEIRPLLLGKCTMFLYLFVMGLVLYQAIYSGKIEWLPYLLVVVLIIACASFIQYLYVACTLISNHQKISGRT